MTLRSRHKREEEEARVRTAMDRLMLFREQCRAARLTMDPLEYYEWLHRRTAHDQEAPRTHAG